MIAFDNAVRQALRDALERQPPTATIFRTGEGRAVSAAEALTWVDGQHPDIQEWLRDVLRTAVRLVQIESEDLDA